MAEVVVSVYKKPSSTRYCCYKQVAALPRLLLHPGMRLRRRTGWEQQIRGFEPVTIPGTPCAIRLENPAVAAHATVGLASRRCSREWPSLCIPLAVKHSTMGTSSPSRWADQASSLARGMRSLKLAEPNLFRPYGHKECSALETADSPSVSGALYHPRRFNNLVPGKHHRRFA